MPDDAPKSAHDPQATPARAAVATPGCITVATLLYVFDGRRRAQPHVLLLARERPPNARLLSPLGGKVNLQAGESPVEGALRELAEETGARLAPDHLRWLGLVTERRADGHHWWQFCYGVELARDPVAWRIAEGALGWFALDRVGALAIPESDRRFLWPLALAFWAQPEVFCVPFALRLWHDGTAYRATLDQPANARPLLDARPNRTAEARSASVYYYEPRPQGSSPGGPRS